MHKLSLKGSAKLVAEFVSFPPSSAVFLRVAFLIKIFQFQYSIHTILYEQSDPRQLIIHAHIRG